MCDFRGDAGISVIHAIKVSPKGASFEIADRHDFIKGMLVTDCDFGMKSGIYATDWTQGWDQPLKGRIYRIFDPGNDADAAIADTRRLLDEGMTERPISELVALLNNADQRVRFEAQWELADRGDAGRDALLNVAIMDTVRRARLHGIWGLWQFALRGKVPAQLLPMLERTFAMERVEVRRAYRGLWRYFVCTGTRRGQ